MGRMEQDGHALKITFFLSVFLKELRTFEYFLFSFVCSFFYEGKGPLPFDYMLIKGKAHWFCFRTKQNKTLPADLPIVNRLLFSGIAKFISHFKTLPWFLG